MTKGKETPGSNAFEENSTTTSGTSKPKVDLTSQKYNVFLDQKNYKASQARIVASEYVRKQDK